MKKKNSIAKLVLNKKTIAKLSNAEKNIVKGGTSGEVCGISLTMFDNTNCGGPCEIQ